jgi:hypothetical protein
VPWPWIRRVRLEHLEIPVDDRIVRIGLTDGVVEYEDADGEMYMDGWSTVEDVARGLGKYAKLPQAQARTVAEEAIGRWRARLGPDHRFEFYRET